MELITHKVKEHAEYDGHAFVYHLHDDDIGFVGESYSGGMVSSSTIVDSTQYSVDSSGSLVTRDVVTEDSTLAGRVSWEEAVNE